MRAILVLSVILLIFSCHKSGESGSLPIPTCTGEHELGFFVNQKVWTPYDKGLYKESELPKVSIKEDVIKISATRVDESAYSRDWFCIEIKNPGLKTGSFNIHNKSCQAPFQTYYYGENKDLPSKVYRLDKSKAQEISITCIDLKKGIISGTFFFSANTFTGDKIEVKKGRFDLLIEK
jgi:hypothetical protein